MPRHGHKQAKGEKKAKASCSIPEGYCVWGALVLGVCGLPGRPGDGSFSMSSCQSMLDRIRKVVRESPESLEQVTCNGEVLTRQRVDEISSAILENTAIKDGQLCGTSDSLLIAYCAAFRVHVVHQLPRCTESYRVPLARREVSLRSSERHMTYVKPKGAAVGLALFASEEQGAVEVDKAAAQAFKDETDSKVKALEVEAAALTGKDNKKARSKKSKEVSALSKNPEYMDATRILNDQEPIHGKFVKSKVAPKAAPKAAAAFEPEATEPAADDKKSGKPKKAAQAEGISSAERKESKPLKEDIIKKKKELMESGMSGGQINEEESIVAMVVRTNELKEKKNPGCFEAAKAEKKDCRKKGKKLSKEQEEEVANLEKEIEECIQKLAGPEFKYSEAKQCGMRKTKQKRKPKDQQRREAQESAGEP